MKLQFLGDSRDSFKWDLLHHVVTSTRPAFRELVFVPMLTPDVASLSHGSTAASSYPCRAPLLPFVRSLATEPRSLERVAALGSIPGMPSFAVQIHSPTEPLGFGWRRYAYWQPLLQHPRANSLVFLDPDNGFETDTQAGPQHFRFGEASVLLAALPPTSALAVFQYRPQGQSWDTVFSRVGDAFPPGFRFVATHHGQLAFIFIGNSVTLAAIDRSVTEYGASQMTLQIRHGGGA